MAQRSEEKIDIDNSEINKAGASRAEARSTEAAGGFEVAKGNEDFSEDFVDRLMDKVLKVCNEGRGVKGRVGAGAIASYEQELVRRRVRHQELLERSRREQCAALEQGCGLRPDEHFPIINQRHLADTGN